MTQNDDDPIARRLVELAMMSLEMTYRRSPSHSISPPVCSTGNRNRFSEFIIDERKEPQHATR